MKVALQLLVSCAAVVTSTVSGAQHEDALIKELPGLTRELSFKHYAGHLELEEKEKLFYWYTESQSDPENDPIVLWLNGGPGCSSLGGLFTENGPFVVRDDLSIKVNRYSWNRKANMVWLESPAGVGFSGDVQGPNYYNDDIVAAKTREFLSLFFKKFSELKNREFYITGESYAGMYIPYLVDRLVEEPIEGVNLKGFAIGNPFTDNIIDGNAYIDYYYSHAMVSLEAYEKIKVQCGAAKALRKRAKPSVQISPTHRGDIGACADTLTHIYLNLPEVQRAIHVTKSTGGKHVLWKGCSDPVGDLYTSSPSSLPKYHNILGRNLKALIYSGDADSVVNFIGTERWLGGQGLKLQITQKWRAWFGPDQQLAGYVQKYEGLTFKTVKGAGHMVPAVRPLHGLNLFECFVYGQDACNKFVYPVDDNEIEAGMTVVQQAAHAKMDSESALKTANGNVISVGSGSSAIWLILPVVCGVLVAAAAVGIRNGKKRARYQRLYSSGYQTVV
ncbi:Serine carboxypeptidase 26 [Phytophthora nicotianae]|uniref:Carboxypeptidase n=1 Tax=Phytophthora nicotianae TaxID=4792 RepID=A0A0W8CKF8_PHYNI|nr:Serine carboxypeptidase 26 [Phytophthora nicotianae]